MIDSKANRLQRALSVLRRRQVSLEVLHDISAAGMSVPSSVMIKSQLLPIEVVLLHLIVQPDDESRDASIITNEWQTIRYLNQSLIHTMTARSIRELISVRHDCHLR